MYIGDDQSGHSGQFGQTIEGQHSQGHYYTDPGAAAAGEGERGCGMIFPAFCYLLIINI
jgi:hypothetical protein